MSKNKFEVVNINDNVMTVDLTFLNNEELYFNATDLAKKYGKKPIEYLNSARAKELIDVILKVENLHFEDLIKTVHGGKHRGTWLDKKISIDFARWCSPEFAYLLDKWIIQKIEEEKHRKLERQLSKLEFPAMTLAIQQAHKNPQHYHYSNECDMINRIVLGCSAKTYCEKNNIDRLCLRDSLPLQIVQLINELQKLNTCLIQIHMSFDERKDKLQIRYAELVQKLLK